MVVVTVDVGGMYSAGKSTIINDFLKLFPKKELITSSNYCNVINGESTAKHKDRSGISRVLFDDLQILVGNEWITDNNGKIVYGEVVGPNSNPFLSEFVFLFQEVNRYLTMSDLCEGFEGDSLVVNDLSFWDSYKMFIPTFHDFNKGVVGKCFDEKMSVSDLQAVKEVIGLDLKDYTSFSKLDVLEHFYSNPYLVKGLGEGDVSLSDLKPDSYIILTVDPGVCVLRAENRCREDLDSLGEGDIRYPAILKEKVESFYGDYPSWNSLLIDTTNNSKSDVFNSFVSELFSVLRAKNVSSSALEQILKK